MYISIHRHMYILELLNPGNSCDLRSLCFFRNQEIFNQLTKLHQNYSKSAVVPAGLTYRNPKLPTLLAQSTKTPGKRKRLQRIFWDLDPAVYSLCIYWCTPFVQWQSFPCQIIIISCFSSICPCLFHSLHQFFSSLFRIKKILHHFFHQFFHDFPLFSLPRSVWGAPGGLRRCYGAWAQPWRHWSHGIRSAVRSSKALRRRRRRPWNR